MGVTTRFATEYPARCLQLIEELEPYARGQKLVGSFSLLAAAAVLTIPFERANAKHFLHKGFDDALTASLKELDRVKFVDAPFWNGEPPGDWRQWHIVENWDDANNWRTKDGHHPFSGDAVDVIGSKRAGKVMRALRNALAHGNVVYLDQAGKEHEGAPLRYLAFLSRYEEGEEAQKLAQTYRLTVATEDDFLRLVKQWARWVTFQVQNDRVIEAT